MLSNFPSACRQQTASPTREEVFLSTPRDN
jgi:hypothetical protein